MEGVGAEKEGFSRDYDSLLRVGEAGKREGSKILFDRENLNKYNGEIPEANPSGCMEC